MRSISNEKLIPFEELDGSVFTGTSNRYVGALLLQLEIMVVDETVDGVKYARLHDSFSHLDMARVIHSQQMRDGRMVNVPHLHWTPDGVAIIREIFKHMLGLADKSKVKQVAEAVRYLKEKTGMLDLFQYGRERDLPSSGCSGKERTKEHVCLHGKCGGCRQEK